MQKTHPGRNATTVFTVHPSSQWKEKHSRLLRTQYWQSGSRKGGDPGVAWLAVPI